jgi:hypothetical protein
MKRKYLLNIIIIICVVVLIYLLIHTVRAGLVTDFSNELSSQVISSASNHTMIFTTSSDFGPDETLEIFFESDFDLSLIDYTDIDFKDDDTDLNLGASAGTGTGGNIGLDITSQTITFTQNDTDTISAGSIITIAIGLNTDYQSQGDQQIYNPSIADSYKISLSGSFGDMGTISVIILNSDSVALQAEIPPELSFIIRDENDTADTASCSLGTINSLGISQCSYRLASETNGINGFQIFIQSDGNFRNNTNFIANISENNQVEQGTEGYGIALSAGTGILEDSDFNDDETPIPEINTLLIKSNSVYNYNEGELTTSSLITHKASVSPTTEAGIYNQMIVYSILANY